jgi:GMP synthase-like glutamine amidotransferase
MNRENLTIWCGEGTPFEGVNYATRWIPIAEHLGLSATIQRYIVDGVGDIPPYGFHLITGSSVAVSDTNPHMGDFLQFLRRLLKNAAKGEAFVFGVCLGCHAIAAASLLTDDSEQNNAATSIVRTSPNGIEVSVRRVADMRKGGNQPVVEFHYEEVDPAFIERANATLEFTNAHSPVQGFSLGPRIRGVQFHPEFDIDDNVALLQYNQSIISSFSNARSTAEISTSINTEEAHRFASSLLKETYGVDSAP